MVALSESVMKNRLKRPLAEKSRWRHLRLAIKPRHLRNHASQIKRYYMDHYQEVMVALSESVTKNRLKRPLAEKSWWRHLRLAIKPRFIGNHTSQMKSYYGTLWGSRGRSIRMHPEKSPEALPSRKTTMTSYPPCNKTALSRKPCILDKTLLRNTLGKSWSLFQNPSWKIAWSAPWWRNYYDVISYLQ